MEEEQEKKTFKKSDYKFVKRANMYVRTWKEQSKNFGAREKEVFKQDWISKEEWEKLP